MSEDIIKELIRTGQVTQEAVDQTRVKVDKTLQACAYTLHTLMCNREHENNPEKAHGLIREQTEKCLWYAEESLEATWDAPEHSLWLRRTLEVMKEQEITEPEVMKEFLRKLTEVSVAVNDLIAWYPKSFRLLEEIANEVA